MRQQHVNARTQHVFLQTGSVGAYSIIFNQLAVAIISSTIHEINPFSWLNLSDFHVSPCHLFPTKLDFALFFLLCLKGPGRHEFGHMHITQTNSTGPSAFVGLFSDPKVPADLADPKRQSVQYRIFRNMHRFQEGFQILNPNSMY